MYKNLLALVEYSTDLYCMSQLYCIRPSQNTIKWYSKVTLSILYFCEDISLPKHSEHINHVMSDIDEDLDLSENGTAALLTFAKSITRNAGEMLRKAFETPRSAYDLKSATDPVTATDKAIEAYIFSAIRAKYPSHKLLGEESASEDLLKDVPTWIIDPLDGTANCTYIARSFVA